MYIFTKTSMHWMPAASLQLHWPNPPAMASRERFPNCFAGYVHMPVPGEHSETYSCWLYIKFCLASKMAWPIYTILHIDVDVTSPHARLRPFKCIIWVHLNQLSVVKWSDVIGQCLQRPLIARAVKTAGGCWMWQVNCDMFWIGA